MGIADQVSLALVLLLSLAFGAMATNFSMFVARKLKALAIPDARSSHQVPTPRLGGFGYFIPLMVVLGLALKYSWVLHSVAGGIEPSLLSLFRLTVICGSLAFVVGLMDDFIPLPPWFKLLGQIVCAALFLYLGSRMVYSVQVGDLLSDDGHVIKQGQIAVIKGAGFAHVALTQGLRLDGSWANLAAKTGKYATHIPPLAAIVTFLWIIILMNAYNFMDGIDGLAAVFVITVALGLFAIYVPEAYAPGLPGLRAHIGVLTGLTALLVGLSLGFLFYNWPPAKTFLGDCGSQFVGFVLAVVLAQATRVAGEPPIAKYMNEWQEFEIELDKRAYVDFLAVLILVWPFLYDVFYTMIRRLLHGKAIWRAHHEHLYQRLLELGWSHRAVVLFSLPFYLVHAALFFAYCWAPNNPARWSVAAAALAPMIIYTLFVIVSEKRPHRRTGNGQPTMDNGQ